MKKPKKKLPPFLAKVAGGAARRRADRKAYARGGAVSKVDLDPISPNEPNAPPGGKVTQQFSGDRPIPRPRGLKKGGVARKLADGGSSDKDAPVSVNRPGLPRGSSPVDLAAAGLTPTVDLAESTPDVSSAPPPPPPSDAPGPLRARRGGSVKK